MEEKEKQNKFKKILGVIIIIAVVLLAIISTILLNNRQKELDDLKDKNDEISSVLVITENF